MAMKSDPFGPSDHAARLLREHLDSPAERLRRVLEDDPLRKAAGAFGDTEALRTTLASHETAGARYAREMREKLLGDRGQQALVQQVLAAKATMSADPAIERYERLIAEAQGRLGQEVAASDLERHLAQAKIAAVGFTVGGGIADAKLDAYRKLLAAGALHSSITDGYADMARRYGLMSERLLGSLTGDLSDVARTNQWASILGRASPVQMDALFGGSALAEVDRLKHTVLGYVGGVTEADRTQMSLALGLDHLVSGHLEATRLKLSALAGSVDVLGFQAATTESAYQQVFGEWHTRPDLPARFWRDPKMRRRMYDEAEVDEGLAEATPAAAIEITVESGLVAGVSHGSDAVLLFDIGGVSMQVRSSDPQVDSFRALIFFELQLRRFIAMKMAAAAGPQWLKQRVDGAVLGKAKQNRAAALSNGEPEAELLEYIDLGDLAGILLRKDNWDQVFGHVFPNRQRLEFDLQAVIATRRPTMHARKVDGVRLVELLCVMSRLTQLMARDGWARTETED